MRQRRRSTFRATVLVVLIGAAANAGLTSAGAAMSAHACSVKGLRFSYKSGSASYGVKVSNLEATGASCTTARSVATTAAKAMLHKRSAPSTIDHFSVHTKSPCSGCSPVWHVTATGATAKITFEVFGGA